MKFSIIGTGFILPSHIQAIRDIKSEIRDVVNDSRGPNLWRKMIRTTDADCIVILTPNYLHHEMILESLDNGKIVLCEKPLVIKTEHVEDIKNKSNIFTVLQLRYHPLVQEIKKIITDKNTIEMNISVYRDEDYYNGWKVQKKKSGGVLFNLGIHYFDLLLHLFGDAKEVKTEYLDDRMGKGVVVGENYTCNWSVSTDAKKEEQKRVFKINGKNYNFSKRDNLSFENLHFFVYEDLLKGVGTLPEESLKSIKLVEELYKSYGK